MEVAGGSYYVEVRTARHIVDNSKPSVAYHRCRVALFTTILLEICRFFRIKQYLAYLAAIMAVINQNK